MSCSSCASDDDVIGPFVQGDSWPFSIELDPDDPYKNVAGATFVVSVKQAKTDPTPIVSYSYTVPLDDPDAPNGIANFMVPSDLTLVVAEGIYWIDIKRVFAGTPPIVTTIYPASQLSVIGSIANVPVSP